LHPQEVPLVHCMGAEQGQLLCPLLPKSDLQTNYLHMTTILSRGYKLEPAVAYLTYC